MVWLLVLLFGCLYIMYVCCQFYSLFPGVHFIRVCVCVSSVRIAMGIWWFAYHQFPACLYVLVCWLSSFLSSLTFYFHCVTCVTSVSLYASMSVYRLPWYLSVFRQLSIIWAVSIVVFAWLHCMSACLSACFVLLVALNLCVYSTTTCELNSA